MPLVCRQCGNRITSEWALGQRSQASIVREHLRLRCVVPENLIADDWRPLPMTTTVPPEVPSRPAISGFPYEGEPRIAMKRLNAAEAQTWVPFWADLIVDLWARWISSGDTIFEREMRREQRDSALRDLASNPIHARAAVTCWRAEGVSGFRSFLKTIVIGPLPAIIEPEIIDV